MNGSRTEQGIVTAGDDITMVAQFLPAGQNHYSALDVIAELEKGLKPAATIQEQVAVLA
jgi:hypothetical protein